jgi:type I restriction enzyme S subunit
VGLRRHTLAPDDILFSSFVADEIRVCLFPAGLPTAAINKADCFCIRADTRFCNPKFLVLRLASPATYAALEDTVHGATRPRISLTQLRAFRFDLPSVGEQVEIVNRIESAFAWIDRLGLEITSARKLMDHLDQAVLAKAFRGELVPQDPSDEPGSALLERIRAERSLLPRERRGTRTRA